MSKKLDEFIASLNDAVANHCIYVWGGQGQKAPKVCETWIRQREEGTGGEKIGGRYRTYADIAVEFWKAQVAAGFGTVLQAFDCSGLLTFFLLKMELIKKDMSANGLMGLCKTTTERRAGYWLFRIGSDGRATHVGVLIDENTVIHAKGRAHGVVKEAFDAKFWHRIGIPSIFDFDEPAPEPEPTPGPTTRKYVKVVGGSVRVRKGNGTKTRCIGIAHRGDELPCFGQADTDPYWYEVEFNGERGYISVNAKYTEIIYKV